MKILFILDPLEKLHLHKDTSLELIRRFSALGRKVWTAEVKDVFYVSNKLFANSSQLLPGKKFSFRKEKKRVVPITKFDLLFIRKEPPFNMSYLYLTQLLDLVSDSIPVLNNPTGIRNANEKLSALFFSKWMPKTIVSSLPENILDFQKKLKNNIIVKPLHERSGTGINLLKYKAKKNIKIIKNMTENGTTFIEAQEFISGKKILGDKRITLLNGNFLTAFEKQFAPGSFRGNLCAGAIPTKATLTNKERCLIKDLKPWIKREGLNLVGLDVLDNRLLEINVTCPGGMVEAATLYPEQDLFGKWIKGIDKYTKNYK